MQDWSNNKLHQKDNLNHQPNTVPDPRPIALVIIWPNINTAKVVVLAGENQKQFFIFHIHQWYKFICKLYIADHL
jgi:hypothetical protein